MFVKKGDKVKVITGKDKNKEGVVLAACQCCQKTPKTFSNCSSRRNR
jgi:ribosomal protein L24